MQFNRQECSLASISRPLLAPITTPPGTLAWPRRGYRPRRRFGPCVGAPCLLDHLVCAHQNRQWYRKAKRLGGREVHDHLEFGRKLHRQIARLLAAQNAIDIGGGTAK